MWGIIPTLKINMKMKTKTTAQNFLFLLES